MLPGNLILLAPQNPSTLKTTWGYSTCHLLKDWALQNRNWNRICCACNFQMKIPIILAPSTDPPPTVLPKLPADTSLIPILRILPMIPFPYCGMPLLSIKKVVCPFYTPRQNSLTPPSTTFSSSWNLSENVTQPLKWGYTTLKIPWFQSVNLNGLLPCKNPKPNLKIFTNHQFLHKKMHLCA